MARSRMFKAAGCCGSSHSSLHLEYGIDWLVHHTFMAPVCTQNASGNCTVRGASFSSHLLLRGLPCCCSLASSSNSRNRAIVGESAQSAEFPQCATHCSASRSVSLHKGAESLGSELGSCPVLHKARSLECGEKRGLERHGQSASDRRSSANSRAVYCHGSFRGRQLFVETFSYRRKKKATSAYSNTS